jgi:hypothetical protein
VLGFHARQIILKRPLHRRREHRRAILAALAIANRQLSAIDVDVPHAQLDTLEQPELEEIAWVLKSDPRRNQIGFVEARNLSRRIATSCQMNGID